MPFEPISSCLSSWVDEKVNLPSSFYVCDKNCADLQDCTDCDSNSMFHVVENFFSNGDFDHDDKISISECKMVVQFASSSLMLYWNGYDTEWEGLSYEGKCAESDTNDDLYLHPDEMIGFFKHFMNFSSKETRQWEFENRYKQVSCDQCEWYQTYNF